MTFTNYADRVYDDGKKIRIEAQGNSDSDIYIGDMEVNGRKYGKTYLTHKDLTAGAEISFSMSGTPDTGRGKKKSDRPYSFSTAE